MKTKKIKLISACMLSILILTSFIFISSTFTKTVSAQSSSDGEYTLLEPLPCIPGQGIVCTDGMKKTIDFRNYMQYAFNLLIGLAAAAAVFMMVWGGFKYMSTDSWSDKSEGLDIFKHAIYGLLLVLASYLILKTIDPRLVEIPSNIVPTITLKKSIDYSAGQFFDQILSDAKKQQAITDLLIDQTKELQAQVTLLETRRAELVNKLSEAEGALSNPDTAQQGEISAWRAELEEITNKINQKEGEALRLSAATSMSAIMAKTDQQLSVDKAVNTNDYVLFYSSVKFDKSEIDLIIDSSIKNMDQKINPPPENLTDYNRIQKMKELAPAEFENLQKEVNKNKISLEIRRLEATLANTKKTGFGSGAIVSVGDKSVGDANEFYNTLKQNTANLEQQVNSQITDPEVKKEFSTRIKDVSKSIIEKTSH